MIDLRSDTLTKPTAGMLAAMMAAAVGDDVYGEDPTVNELEARVADRFGKEAALFVPTGTMGNQIAVRIHCRPQDEVLLEASNHIYLWEAGGPAALSGVTLRTIPGRFGVLTVADLEPHLHPDDMHSVRSRLVCLENTHNRGGGCVYPLDTIATVSAWARANGLAMHLDGARLWNAEVASGVGPREWARHFDTLMVSFSKGLGTPSGSALVGPSDLLAHARRVRKLFGGAMRQVGFLAAACLYGMDRHVARLADDHVNAKLLAAAVRDVPGLTLLPGEVETNLVWAEVSPALGSARDVSNRLKEDGVLAAALGTNVVRFVTHLDVSRADCERRVGNPRVGTHMTDDFTRPSARPDATAVAAPGSTPAPDGTVPGGVEAVRPFANYPVVPGYSVTGELGRGGMGWVLTATDLRFGRDVAVKLPLPGLATNHACRLFVHEAVITGRLAHPGIPPAHHLGELPDGTPFLAMKLVRGQTLATLLAARSDPGHDLPRFVGVFEQVCQAVGYAHDQGVLHRDLKPGNVMVGAFGEVQVMDWGLAVQRDDGGWMKDAAAAPAGRGRDSTEVVGTPAYMAPEQARGERVDARADVFALGGMLAAVLVGRPPFWADQASSTLAQAAAGDTEDVLVALAGCGADAELVGIARRCLAADPAARPADGTTVARLLAAHRAGVEERLRIAERDRAAAETRAVEQRKRRGVELVLAAALVVLVAGAGVVTVWRVRESAEDDHRAAVEREELAREAAEDERRTRTERERTARATAGVADLLDQAEAALRAGAADRAGPLLDQAARRAADDGLTDSAARLAADTRALTVLRELDRIDSYRWTPVGPRYPSPQLVARQWEAALAAYRVVPTAAPSAEDVARVTDTPVRSALLAALDGWLGRVPSEPVRALLAAADTDPFRTQVRRLMAAQDAAGLAAAADRPEWAGQPAGLVEAYAAEEGVPIEVRRALLTRVAAARPDDFGVLMDLGATYPLGGAAAERARWFQAAVALRPGSAAARLSLGSALRVAGDKAGAVAACREAVRLDPRSPAARNNLGTALATRGELDAAVEQFRESIKLDPADPFPHHNLGHALAAKRDPDGAVAAYREAIRLQPTNAETFVSLGGVLAARPDLDGALVALREAVRLDPASAAAHNGLGNVLGRRQDFDGAAAAYREALRHDPGVAPVHANLGRVLRAKGEAAAAVAAFREAVRLDSRDPAHHNGLGLALEAAYDLAGAEAAFREAARLDPKSPIAPANLGEVLRKQGRPAEAAEAFRASLAVRPDSGFARAGLEYCLRVGRGEVPTAPPPRPAGR